MPDDSRSQTKSVVDLRRGDRRRFFVSERRYTPTLGGDALIGPTGLELGVGGTLVAALYLTQTSVAMLTCEWPSANSMQNFLYKNIALAARGNRLLLTMQEYLY